MLDPLTLFMVGAGVLAYRELNKKDYGVLTPAREERYQNMMVSCYDPQLLAAEAKLFADYGLKAQAAMLKRRGEWRSRSEEVKKAHEDIFQKAMKSTNVAAILEIAGAFEGWTATKKAGLLREYAHTLYEKRVSEDKTEREEQEKGFNGPNGTSIPQNE